MTTADKVEQLTKTVEQTQAAYARALELYEDEPTRAHEENYREAKSEHRLAKRSLSVFQNELAREASAPLPRKLRAGKGTAYVA